MQFAGVSQLSRRCLKWFGQNVLVHFSKDWDFLLVFFLPALVLRIYLALAADVGALAESREIYNLNKLAFEGGFNYIQAPLYPFFLRVIYALFGDYNYKAVFLVQGILNSFVVLLVYLVIVRLCNRTAAIIGAAICGFSPNIMIYNLSISPAASGLLTAALLMTTLAAPMKERWRACISACLTGLGILIWPVMWFLIPGTLAVLKKRILYLSVLVVILAPWTIRNSLAYEGVIPLYHPRAFQLDLKRYTAVKDGWRIVHQIYNNAAVAVTKKGLFDSKTMKDETRRDSVYIATYVHFIIRMLGLMGLAGYYAGAHRNVMLPVIGYAVLFILFSKFEARHRMLLEPALVVYASILIESRFKKRVPTAGSGRRVPD